MTLCRYRDVKQPFKNHIPESQGELPCDWDTKYINRYETVASEWHRYFL